MLHYNALWNKQVSNNKFMQNHISVSVSHVFPSVRQHRVILRPGLGWNSNVSLIYQLFFFLHIPSSAFTLTVDTSGPLSLSGALLYSRHTCFSCVTWTYTHTMCKYTNPQTTKLRELNQSMTCISLLSLPAHTHIAKHTCSLYLIKPSPINDCAPKVAHQFTLPCSMNKDKF